MAFTAQQEEELKALAARMTRRMRDLPEQTVYDSSLFIRVLDEDNPDPSRRDRKMSIDLAGIGQFASITTKDGASRDFVRLADPIILGIAMIWGAGNGNVRIDLSRTSGPTFSFHLSLVDMRTFSSKKQIPSSLTWASGSLAFSHTLTGAMPGNPYAVVMIGSSNLSVGLSMSLSAS